MKNSNVNTSMNHDNTSKEFVYDCNPLYATRRSFKEAIEARHINLPLSYSEWCEAPSELKVAILYVQFFEQIKLAYYKTRTDAGIDSEMISEVVMHLMKKQPLFEADENKFRPSFVYTISYNCMYCKSVDPCSGQTAKTSWFNNVESQYKVVGDDVVDQYESASDGHVDLLDDILSEDFRDKFWSAIESIDDVHTRALINSILDDHSDPDLLRRVPRKQETKEKIFAALREKLAEVGINGYR